MFSLRFDELMMKFTLIIATLGRKTELKRCLDSIEKQDAEYEVIVMDQNPPEFGIQEICNGRKGMRYFHSSILGLSINRNKAIVHSTGHWTIFADDDCVLGDTFLAKAKSILEMERTSESIFFTDVRNLEDGRFYTFELTEKDNKINYGNFRKIPSIGFIFSKDALIKLGGFDERLGVGAKYGSGEDTDILLRALRFEIPVARLSGCSIFHPRMSKAKNLNRGKNYAMGYGALFAKQILVQPWTIKIKLGIEWCTILSRNLGAILIFAWNPGKSRYYAYSLFYKLKGFSSFLLFDSRRGNG
jgi:glycosyltransferase involved in cell wall biosynthesis